MRYRHWFAAGIIPGIILGLGINAQAQKHESGSTNSTSSPSQEPGAASDLEKNANFATMQQYQNRGSNFTGNVKVEGGALPWDPIPVVVTCNGADRYRTVANAQGEFAVQANSATSQATPAGNPHEAAASQLAGCDAEASLPGFVSSKLHINGNNSNLGTITLHPDSAAAGSSTSATTGAAPKEASKHYDKAREEWMNRDAKGAEKELEKAVKIDPGFADAWYQLGKLQQTKNQQAALDSYQKAVAADPKFVSPYEHIAEISASQKKWQDLANATSAALKLDPTGTPQLWYFDALGKYNLGKIDDAEASAQKALAIDPEHVAPNTEQLLAVMLAGQGDLAGALQHLKNSLTYVKPGPNADVIKQQIAQLEKAQGGGN